MPKKTNVTLATPTEEAKTREVVAAAPNFVDPEVRAPGETHLAFGHRRARYHGLVLSPEQVAAFEFLDELEKIRPGGVQEGPHLPGVWDRDDAQRRLCSLLLGWGMYETQRRNTYLANRIRSLVLKAQDYDKRGRGNVSPMTDTELIAFMTQHVIPLLLLGR